MAETFAELIGRRSIEINEELRKAAREEQVHTLAELARFSIESNFAYHFKPRPTISPEVEASIRGAVDLANLEAIADQGARASRDAVAQQSPSFTF